MQSEVTDSLLHRGLLAMLHRRRPPEQNSAALDEIVHALTLALGRGEISLELLEGDQVPEGIENEGWPELHRQALLASGWLDGDEAVMTMNHNTLSWRRWHGAMQEIEMELQHRCLHAPVQTSPGTAGSKRQPGNHELNPEQRKAVEAMDHHGVILLSGGPGTGKTSTVLHMLLRAFEHRPQLRARLAAPTGKAARRLQDAIQTQSTTASLPCTTLHRLLEARPGGFGRHQRNPLQLDLLIVDEMSMVDLDLCRALLDALPKDCQLVLVGDSAQLPPIGIGAVWQYLQSPIPNNRFQGGAVNLKTVYRNRGSLAEMSALLRDHGLERFWCEVETLPHKANINVSFQSTNRIPKTVLTVLTRHLNHLKSAASQLKINRQGQPDQQHAHLLLSKLDSLMVLCPRRLGPWGVDAVHQCLINGSEIQNWPSGLPVLCCENQPELGLANGDLGIVIHEGLHQRILFLSTNDMGETQHALFHPARLQKLEPALALTIHKAQGCEMDQVMLLWPDLKKHQTSALLYTAITRAKMKLQVFADPSVLALGHSVNSRDPESRR